MLSGRLLASCVLLCAFAFGQSLEDRAADSGAPAFEVASVKLAGPTTPVQDRLRDEIAESGPFGFLPGSGRRIELRGMTLGQLVAAAYRIPLREVVGPSWISDVRFDIEALIPAGQPRNKAPEMLLTLLQERFALQAHHDVRKTSGYILSVAEGGPKFKTTTG